MVLFQVRRGDAAVSRFAHVASKVQSPLLFGSGKFVLSPSLHGGVMTGATRRDKQESIHKGVIDRALQSRSLSQRWNACVGIVFQSPALGGFSQRAPPSMVALGRRASEGLPINGDRYRSGRRKRIFLLGKRKR